MDIQPDSPLPMTLSIEGRELFVHMFSFSQTRMVVHSKNYIDKYSITKFKSAYFQGTGRIEIIEFLDGMFIYHIDILDMQFRPGLVIDTST